mgnify:CR=1 FL=1
MRWATASLIFFAVSIPLRSCNAKPCIRVHIVFGDALAFGVLQTKIDLRLQMALFGRLGVPENRFGIGIVAISLVSLIVVAN